MTNNGFFIERNCIEVEMISDELMYVDGVEVEFDAEKDEFKYSVDIVDAETGEVYDWFYDLTAAKGVEIAKNNGYEVLRIEVDQNGGLIIWVDC